MKHLKISIVLNCLLFFLLLLFVLLCRRLYIKEQWLLTTYEQESIPGIVCYGDSLTFGTGAIQEGVSYPSVLEELLEKNHFYIPVSNLGIGGDNTVTIAGRAGGIPFRIKAFTIPEGSQPVEISFLPSDGQPIRIDKSLAYGGAGLNDCFIQGIEGKITLQKYDDISHYYFTRNTPGSSVSIPEGTPIISGASLENKDKIFIVWMGENHGYSNTENLIEQYHAILNMQEKNAGKYIVIGLTTGAANERAELEQAMQKEFGDKYINLREILSTEGLSRAKLKATKEDMEQTAQGCVPPSLLYDDIHFNADGYRVIGTLVYERLISLGYLDEIAAEAQLYGSFEY